MSEKHIAANANMKDYIIKGILEEEYLPSFFSSIQKIPTNMGPNAAAAVTMTENGIRLIYDVTYFSKCTKDEIDFVLSHELLHILNYHFLRGDEMMEEYDIAVSEFYSKYAPMADLPVNYSIRQFATYEADKDHLLTYDTAKMSYDEYPTFESIVKYMLSDKEKEKELCDKLGIGKTVTVIQVSDDGTVKQVPGGSAQGNGPTVVIPDISSEGKREALDDVANIIRGLKDSVGSGSYTISDAVDRFLDEYDNRAMKGWDLLQMFLTGERSISKGHERTYSRLNRRTRRLPGKKKIKGFSAMFIVDESGSMPDEDIQLAFTLVKKVVLRENNDKVYIVHWDTQPVGEVDEIQYESDMDTLERKLSGGTDFAEFFRHEVFHQNDYDLYVCITDGWPSSWPVCESDKPVIWIITEEAGFQKYKSDYNKGIGVCIEEN